MYSSTVLPRNSPSYRHIHTRRYFTLDIVVFTEARKNVRMLLPSLATMLILRGEPNPRALAMASAAFDAPSYEADRLARDAEAMAAMQGEADAAFAGLRTPWKWVIRKRIWDYMEEKEN